MLQTRIDAHLSEAGVEQVTRFSFNLIIFSVEEYLQVIYLNELE